MFALGAKTWGCCLLVGLGLAPGATAQESLTARLATPLSASSSRRGDTVRATVVTPPAFQGDTLQGQVTETKSSRGQSIVQFNLVSLLHRGISVPVSATVTSVSNSHGQPGMDEQSRSLAASNPPPSESQTRSHIGSRLGGMLGGNAGGAISDASNSSGAPQIPAIRVVCQGPGIELAMGATMGLSVSSTGQQSLDSLEPNAAASALAGEASAPSAAASSEPAPAATSASQSAPAAGGDSAGAAQPELKSVKIDFVPGERTIFFDDFSDMAPDEPPPHWKVRNGPPELRMGGNIRELYSKDTVQLTSPAFEVPQNFTFELVWTGNGETDWTFRDKDGDDVIHAMVRGEEDGKTASASIESHGNLGEGTIQTDTSKPVVFDLWAQQGRVRAYLNGQRLVDVNQVQFKPMTVLEGSISGYRPNGIRSVRIAESAPDFSSVINASGKYVTHGINFDTDSDRLRPESAAVLKQVVAGLIKNPNLKLEIDGYTDSVGDAGHNLDLSKRRAEAVRSVLVTQFGVDASRLTSSGFGADKPIGSNDTPDGRAENRRVEFVKR
ncbi:MAG TPA: OmpA family protein [Bryobacteraceae bacterium]|nr:OmpA family protein [Bryobacteraceae bacterium]